MAWAIQELGKRHCESNFFCPHDEESPQRVTLNQALSDGVNEHRVKEKAILGTGTTGAEDRAVWKCRIHSVRR